MPGPYCAVWVNQGCVRHYSIQQHSDFNALVSDLAREYRWWVTEDTLEIDNLRAMVDLHSRDLLRGLREVKCFFDRVRRNLLVEDAGEITRGSFESFTIVGHSR
jgi:hypothetical protein